MRKIIIRKLDNPIEHFFLNLLMQLLLISIIKRMVRLLKKQILLMAILVTTFVFCSFSIHGVRSQPYYDAWFTHIYVTNSNSEIDLINGGTAKVYNGQEAVKELVFYNDGCGLFGADLYTRIYRDGELVGTSSETYVGIGSSDTDEFSAILSGPATYSYEVELWWENWGQHLLVDVKEFEIKVVKLKVSNWAPATLSIERGFESGDLTVTFTNGGNDYMYDTSVSVIDSAGLTVTPQTQDLGTINEGGTKAATFSVQASGDKSPKDYAITFEVAYNELRGVTHRETFQADVTVTSNFIRENLSSILIVFIIITISVVTGIVYVKMRKPKQIETKGP